MKVIIASHNQGKIKEYKKVLGEYGYEVLSQSDAGINIEVEETGNSYKENARLKAEAIFNITKTAVLSDDSGLSIDYFNGGPGLYSARFKPELTQDEKNKFIINEMKNEKNRDAKFVCAICFIKETGEKIEVEAVCKGKISTSIRENREGFGYDPIFEPEGYTKTFGELTLEEKDSISHRGKAIELLRLKLE